VLNLDADLELAAGPRYQPSRQVRDAVALHASRLEATLLAPGDMVVDEASPPSSARGLSGVAFCPTPRALALLCRAGAEPEPHPSVVVLRHVNSRAFAASLGQTLPGAAFVTDKREALAMLRGPSPLGEAWRVKHAFGMTGRNQRVVPHGRIEEGDVAFVTRGILSLGVQIEPNVAIHEEYAIHGFLHEDGSLTRGTLVRQRCDARGAWLSTERIPEGDGDRAAIREPMEVELARVAGALDREGYFGPFGIDAYTYAGASGERCFQPRSEINARYSMGFAVGLSGRASARELPR
jgi:hypothetical protein